MELKLTFNESEIRKVYHQSFEMSETSSKERRQFSTILLVLGAFCLGMTSVHFDWIYYAAFFLSLAIVLTIQAFVLESRNSNLINKQKIELEEWVRKYRTIDNIKYVYDNENIKYFESGKLICEISWSNIVAVDKSEEWICVFFEDGEQTIRIPRVLADKREIEIFEQEIDQKLENCS
jgi:hypothetical protein